MSPTNSGKDPLKDASDPLVKQEKLFKSPLQDMNTVFEISPADRRSRAGVLGMGSRARIELDVGLVGEEPVQSDQNKVGEDFLFDAALGLAVKVLDDEDALAHFVKLLDAPSAMVDVRELLERIAMRIEQGGAQVK